MPYKNYQSIGKKYLTYPHVITKYRNSQSKKKKKNYTFIITEGAESTDI